MSEEEKNIQSLKQRAKEMLEGNNTRVIGAEEIYTIICEWEQEKEKNGILEDLLQGRLYELYLYYKDLAGSYQANSISKDKIKEKIKELEAMSISQEIYYDDVKNLLEELLEEE